MDQREYIVTYVTKDGEEKEATMSGRSHRDVERQVAAMGGRVLNVQRAEDEYPAKRAHAKRREVGCAIVVLAIVVLAIVAYWYRIR